MNHLQGKKILIIDDDPALREIVSLVFSEAGAQVYPAANGREGLRQFFAHRPDLITLDLMMPEIDGWEICQQIRQTSDVPIIMLTALSEDNHIVQGLNCGAVDFITKPFNRQVLLARARVALRQAAPSANRKKATIYQDDYLTIDLDQQRVLVRGQPVKLTPTEHRLLTYLCKNAGRLLTFRQILYNVWGEMYQDSVEYIHVHISNLRHKLEEDPKNPRYLVSEYGLGYRFEI